MLRPETIKLLRVNTGGELPDIGPGGEFLDLTPKAQATKAKTNMGGYPPPEELCQRVLGP